MDELGAVMPGRRVNFPEIGALFPTSWQQFEQRMAWMYGDGTGYEQQGSSNLRVEFATGRAGSAIKVPFFDSNIIRSRCHHNNH